LELSFADVNFGQKMYNNVSCVSVVVDQDQMYPSNNSRIRVKEPYDRLMDDMRFWLRLKILRNWIEIRNKIKVRNFERITFKPF